MKTILNCIKALARRLQPSDIAEGKQIEQRICAAHGVTNTKELGLRVTAKSFSISTDKHKSSNHLNKEAITEAANQLPEVAVEIGKGKNGIY